MRLSLCVLLLIVAGISTPRGYAQPFHAGFTRLTIRDVEPFDAFVAYPTQAPEIPVQDGPFTLAASRDVPVAPVSSRAPYPVVLFSHGSGRGPGTPLVHRDLLLHLARQGFIVVAPFHPGTRQPLKDRPRQVRKALATAQADSRFAAAVDPARAGMIGFSFGGAVTLIAAGAMADLAHLSAYCREHRDDPRACDGIPTDGSLDNVPAPKSPDTVSLKALVLLEPFGALFERQGLAAIDLPVLLYHALQSDLRVEGNAGALARALPRPPQHLSVPGRHFVFVDPCPAMLLAQAPVVCSDPPDVDRAAIHQRLRPEVADFLRRNL